MLKAVSPDFKQLLQIIATSAENFQWVHVVLASVEDYRFLEVTDHLPRELQESLMDGFLVLGLIGWQTSPKGVQARRLFFRWNESKKLAELFDQICNAGVNSVLKQIDARPEQT